MNARIRLVFLLLLALIATGGWLNFRSNKTLRESLELVIDTQTAILQDRLVLNLVTDAETSIRGFVVTRDREFLEPYDKSCQGIEPALVQLETLTKNDAPQHARVRDLVAAVQAKLEHMKRVLDGAELNGFEAASAIVQTGEGNRLMALVRMQVEEIESHQQNLLASYIRSARSSYRTAQLSALGGALAGIVLVLAVYFLTARFDRLRLVVTRSSSAAEARLRDALSSMGDAVIITDGEGLVTFCNPVSQSLLSIGNDKVGTPLTELAQFIEKSAGSSRGSIFDRAQKEGGVHRTSGETKILLANGKTLPVEVTAARLGGQPGFSRGSILVLRDTSERLERDREFTRGVLRFRSLVSATAQIVWTTDSTGRTREDSPTWRAATGQSYEELLGDGWLRAVHPQDQERVRTEWKEAVTKQQSYYGEFRLRLADGEYLWTATRAVPVIEEDGTVLEWIAMNDDIRHRKQAEHAQNEAVKRKDEFVALLAHELRNPLAPLRNGLELLKQGGPEHAPQAFDFIERQVKHMTRLIDDLLDASRISQGKLQLCVERIDLREPLRHAADQALPAVLGKRQRLFVSLPPTPAWIEGDYDRLMQIVTNMLNNAQKYSGEGASLWLTAEREGEEFLIIVRDTGQGIAADMRGQIWDMFMQGAGKAEGSEGGLGIGLTLVRRLVELHKGSVQVHSEGPGTGSEFQVRLPAAARVGAVLPPAGKPAAIPDEALRILVIDDNEDSAVSLSMLLRVRGHDVRTAFSGAQGLSEFASFHPLLVFCDIGMPKMSGHDVAREIRWMPDGRSALLVALTGFGTSVDREVSARAGFDLHLVKPVDAEGLANSILQAAQRQIKA